MVDWAQLSENIMKHKIDNNSSKIRKWIGAKPAMNRKRLRLILQEHGHAEHGITEVLRGDKLVGLRKTIIKQLKIS